MTAQELRRIFIEFFVKRGHREIPNVSLIPEHDPTVLFTTAGMHPLVPYLLGEPHPQGKRLVNVQRCLRTDDILKVGDATHLTFFEMLGNWSLGDYWKEEAIGWSFEFLTRELEIPLDKLAVTVFAGDEDVPQDEESIKIWKKLGIPENRISPRPKKDNWWGPVGASGPCGPDTEMFVWVGKEKPTGQPNEDNRWVEVWNDVFIEYNRKLKNEKTEKLKNKYIYEPLAQRNVDTGMGLERMLMVLQNKESVYETDVFTPIMEAIGGGGGNSKPERIIADHLRASVFLVGDGVLPGNKDREYVLRRLVRRAVRYAKSLGLDSDLIKRVTKAVVAIYKDEYPSLAQNENQIRDILAEETKKFERTLLRGLQEIEKLKTLDGKIAFYLYESFGFPLELTEEMALERGQKIDKEEFEKEFRKHQEQSRAASGVKFAGGLADHSEEVIRGHTATHLLHQALRDVLGPQVYQTGSNITPSRVRFDFSHPNKLTGEELHLVENLVNQKIKEDLVVERKIIPLRGARELGAIGLFPEKYQDQVSIYGIGPRYTISATAKDKRERGGYYSLEFCGGPHVSRTSEVGHVKIVKEEALGSSNRRIYMKLQ